MPHQQGGRLRRGQCRERHRHGGRQNEPGKRIEKGKEDGAGGRRGEMAMDLYSTSVGHSESGRALSEAPYPMRQPPFPDTAILLRILQSMTI